MSSDLFGAQVSDVTWKGLLTALRLIWPFVVLCTATLIFKVLGERKTDRLTDRRRKS